MGVYALRGLLQEYQGNGSLGLVLESMGRLKFRDSMLTGSDCFCLWDRRFCKG